MLLALIRRFKIQKTGKRGYMIGVPREFVEIAGLNPGDSVRLCTNNKVLVLVPDGVPVPSIVEGEN